MKSDAVAMLRSYFDFIQREAEQTGYPKSAAFANDFSGGGYGSRVLVMDMSRRLKRVRVALSALSLCDREVLTVKYLYDRHPNGKPVTDAQRAELLDCSLSAFRKRRTRALKRFCAKLEETR